MEADLDAADKLQRDMAEARSMGIAVTAPHVNLSHYRFSIQGEAEIRVGLGGIKGISKKAMQALVESREQKGLFANLDDLIHKTGTDKITKKDLECLIKVSAMDDFGDRTALLAIMPAVYERAAKQGSMAALGQIGLFSSLNGTELEAAATPLPLLDKASDTQKIQWEKELMGVFLTTHPLANFDWIYLLKDMVQLEKIPSLRAGPKVKVLAYVESIKTIRIKKNNKPMSFLSIADYTATCEAVMFNGVYNEFIDPRTPRRISRPATATPGLRRSLPARSCPTRGSCTQGRTARGAWPRNAATPWAAPTTSSRRPARPLPCARSELASRFTSPPTTRAGPGSRPTVSSTLWTAGPSRPAARATLAGWFDAGTPDTYEICTKDSGSVYAWRSIIDTTGTGTSNSIETSVAITSAGTYFTSTVAAAWVAAGTEIVCRPFGTATDGLTPER